MAALVSGHLEDRRQPISPVEQDRYDNSVGLLEAELDTEIPIEADVRQVADEHTRRSRRAGRGGAQEPNRSEAYGTFSRQIQHRGQLRHQHANRRGCRSRTARTRSGTCARTCVGCQQQQSPLRADHRCGFRTGRNRCGRREYRALHRDGCAQSGRFVARARSADGGRRRHWSRSQTEISILSFVDVVRYSARSTSARPKGGVPGPVALPPRTGHRQTAVG